MITTQVLRAKATGTIKYMLHVWSFNRTLFLSMIYFKECFCRTHAVLALSSFMPQYNI